MLSCFNYQRQGFTFQPHRERSSDSKFKSHQWRPTSTLFRCQLYKPTVLFGVPSQPHLSHRGQRLGKMWRNGESGSTGVEAIGSTASRECQPQEERPSQVKTSRIDRRPVESAAARTHEKGVVHCQKIKYHLTRIEFLTYYITWLPSHRIRRVKGSFFATENS